MSWHLMVDLETISTQPNAAILAIGAVLFNPETPESRREFYRNVSLKDCMDRGLHVSAETIYWWARQEAKAGKALAKDRHSLPAAILEFHNFFNSAEASWDDVRIWGNGAAFDIPILESACAAAGYTHRWKFWNVRCYRTVSNMVDRDFYAWGSDDGVPHNALEDAKYQTNRLLAIAGKLNLTLN